MAAKIRTVLFLKARKQSASLDDRERQFAWSESNVV